ncbi:MAG: ATP phosphoribosyltransferase regulatory subunit [Pseudomonadota bacterium]
MSQLFGTLDLDELATGLRAAFADGGALPVETDAVQPMTPYLEFLGETYRDTLVEYSSAEHDEYCLRPDLTLAIAREVASGRLDAGRYGYDDLVFRGARRVRLDESRAFAPLQRQVGVEVFGAGQMPGDDAEMLLQTIDALNRVGVNDIQIVVSDVALIWAVIEGFDLHANWKWRLQRAVSKPKVFERVVSAARGEGRATSALAEALSTLSEQAAHEAVEEIFTMSGFKQLGSRSIGDVADRLVTKAAETRHALRDGDANLLAQVLAVAGSFKDALEQIADLVKTKGAKQRLDALGQLFERLGAGGLASQSIRFDADLSRHLSYYDGFVFEVFDTSGEVFLGGGGRYDGLVHALSNGTKDAPAIGAMLRPDRILSLT